MANHSDQAPDEHRIDQFAPLAVKRRQLVRILDESSPRAAEELHTIFVTISDDIAYHPDGPAILESIGKAEVAGDEARSQQATRRWQELVNELEGEANHLRDLCIAHARRLELWGGIAILLGRVWDAVHEDLDALPDREAVARAERVRSAAMKGLGRVSREEFEAFMASQPPHERTGALLYEFAGALRNMPAAPPAAGEGVELPPLAAEKPPGCVAAFKQLLLALLGRGSRRRGGE